MMVTPGESSFDSLFRAEFPSVLRAAQVIVGDVELARDIAQDAFTTLFVHWKKVSTYERPDAWVRRVAINAAIAQSKRRRRQRQIADAFERQRLGSEGRPIDDRLDPLFAALGGLSAHQRAAVALFYLEDMPVSAVAGVMGTSESTVKVHLHRARHRLAEVLNEEVTDGPG